MDKNRKIAVGSVIAALPLVVALLNDWKGQGAWNQIQELFAWINTKVVQAIVGFFTLSLVIPLWGVIVIIVLGWILLRIIRATISRVNRPTSSAQGVSSPLFNNPARFRDVWIEWYQVRVSGYNIAPGTYDIEINHPLRCAKDGCQKRIVTVAQVHEGEFLVCEDGHFVGNEQGYEYWTAKFVEGQKQAQERRDAKRKAQEEEYEKFKAEVQTGHKTQQELEKWMREQPGELGGSFPLEIDIETFLWAGNRRGQEILTNFIDNFKEARQYLLFQHKISKQQAK